MQRFIANRAKSIGAADPKASLPPELGVDAVVAAEQAPTLAEFFKNQLYQSLISDGRSATTLAWLHETSADAGAVPLRLGVVATNAAWWYGLKKKTGDLIPYAYLIHVPQPRTSSESRKFPLIIFLHGIGERGDDLQRVAVSGPPAIIKHEADWPFINTFIIASPQCPPREWWDPLQLRDLLDEIIAKYPVDPDRIYLTGLSMGGYGTWAFAQAFPQRSAAIAPICGAGDPLDARRLKDLPIWAFHGDKDPVVPIEGDYQMIRALRDIQGRVRFTVYPNVGHVSWIRAYADQRLYGWFLQQRRGAPTQKRAAVSGTQPSEE